MGPSDFTKHWELEFRHLNFNSGYDNWSSKLPFSSRFPSGDLSIRDVIMMPKTPRIHRNMFWDHLTLPNIENSISDHQISTLGTTIGPRNLPFRPGFPQETFWILVSGFWILDYCFWILDLGSWILDLGSWILASCLLIIHRYLFIKHYSSIIGGEHRSSIIGAPPPQPPYTLPQLPPPSTLDDQ